MRSLDEHITQPRQVFISKWENPDFFYPDDFQNFLGPKLDQGLSSDLFSGRSNK